MSQTLHAVNYVVVIDSGGGAPGVEAQIGFGGENDTALDELAAALVAAIKGVPWPAGSSVGVSCTKSTEDYTSYALAGDPPVFE